MDDIRVTVMIPTFNQAEYIGQCIESALSQDYKNFEVIVSDDASTDKTSEVIKRFKSNKRFKYFRNSTNIGRVKNYHKLLYDYATGAYVINLDGDDYFCNVSYISEAVDVIKKNRNEKIAFVFGDQLVYDEEYGSINRECNEGLEQFLDGNNLFLDFPQKMIRMPLLSVLFNRKMAIDLDFFKKPIISSDWESLIRLMIKNNVIYINNIAGVWRKHGKNETKNINLDKIIDNFKLADYPYEYAVSTGVFEYSALLRWKKQMYYRLAKSSLSKYLYNGNAKSTIKYLRAVYKLNKKTFFKLILNIKTIAELILSVYPPLLRFVDNKRKKKVRNNENLSQMLNIDNDGSRV